MNNTFAFFRLTSDTFVRNYAQLGFMVNQATREDRVWDENGAVFLEQLTRTPQSLDKTVDALMKWFVGVSREELRHDFVEFIEDLERDKFVVTGSSPAALDTKEPVFSYDNTYEDKPIVQGDMEHLQSAVVLDEHFRKHPSLYGMQIEITPQCNLKCVHCYMPLKPEQQPVTTPEILDVLDQLKDMGTLDVSFTGGEPMLNPDLPRLLQRARENDFSIGLLTNAALLTDELLAVFKEVNMALIQISLYSMDARVHDRITCVNGSWEKTKRSIERLIENNIRVQVNCPIMKENLASFHDVLEWAEKKRIKVNNDFLIMARTDFSTDNLKHRIDDLEKVSEAIEHIIKYDNNYRAMIESPAVEMPPRKPENAICGVGTNMMCLAANGDYYPCSGYKMILGNCREQSVRAVWETSQAIRELRGITNAYYPECLVCQSRNYCSLCLARIYNENNGKLRPIPAGFCNAAHLNRTLVEDYRSGKLRA